MKETLDRLLCVDDEQFLLRGLKRSLRGRFEVVTASNGAEALEIVERQAPFMIIISDMRMPGMSGVEVLRRVREQSPDTVRILLTGYADLEAAIGAVNEGNIFRFLSKPCPTPTLVRALRDASLQHRLITAERVLLRRTLVGILKTLSNVLSLANPVAFGRASRARRDVTELTAKLGFKPRWEVEAAALLSQIGCVTLPPETAKKAYRGAPLTAEERAMVKRIPAVASGLLEDIPRLEEVRRILTYQDKHFDGAGLPADEVRAGAIPLGSRLLKIVLDFDALTTRGLRADEAADTLRCRDGWYDPSLLNAFAQLKGCKGQQIHELPLRKLRQGMVFAEDLTAGADEVILVARGQEVTVELLERIWNFSQRIPLNEPIRVVLTDDEKSGHTDDKPGSTKRVRRERESRSDPLTEGRTRAAARTHAALRELRRPGRSTVAARRRGPEGKARRSA